MTNTVKNYYYTNKLEFIQAWTSNVLVQSIFLGRVLYAENLDKKAIKINGGFLSSTKRFSQPRDLIVKKSDPENPGT